MAKMPNPVPAGAVKPPPPPAPPGRKGLLAPHTDAPLTPPTIVVVESRSDFHGQPKAVDVIVRTPMAEYRGVVKR